MEQMQIYEHEQFGKIRTLTKDGDIWFVATDICDALDIKNTTDAVKRLDDDERSRFNLGRQGMTNCVNEYGLYKMFFIFGYPWERMEDFDHFEQLMRRVFALPLRVNVSLRIKWTPFIPQPCTPLGKERARYDYRMVDKINIWHALNARPRRNPGWYVENDGLMEKRSHDWQCKLTAGDERVLLRLRDAKPLWRMG